MSVKAYSTLGLIVRAGDICHDIIFALGRGSVRRVVLARVSKEEAHVSNRVVAFGGFETADCIFKTIGSNTVVEAAPFHGLSGDAYDLLDSTGRVHDGQSTGKPIEEKGSSRLVSLILGSEVKLAGQMR
jgi:hypothetical protein